MKRDFAGVGRGGENEGGMGGIGDVSEMGSVTEKEKKNYDRYRCQPHPGLQ